MGPPDMTPHCKAVSASGVGSRLDVCCGEGLASGPRTAPRGPAGDSAGKALGEASHGEWGRLEQTSLSVRQAASVRSVTAGGRAPGAPDLLPRRYFFCGGVVGCAGLFGVALVRPVVAVLLVRRAVRDLRGR